MNIQGCIGWHGGNGGGGGGGRGANRGLRRGTHKLEKKLSGSRCPYDHIVDWHFLKVCVQLYFLIDLRKFQSTSSIKSHFILPNYRKLTLHLINLISDFQIN